MNSTNGREDFAATLLEMIHKGYELDILRSKGNMKTHTVPSCGSMIHRDALI
jgi:hypothetical protein